jgi:hypothetical protein
VRTHDRRDDMESVIAALLSAIVALLFYALVERRHKIVLGKLILTVFVTGVIVGGIAWMTRELRDRSASRRDMKALSRGLAALNVTFLPESSHKMGQYLPSNPFAPFEQVAFRVCNVSTDTVDAFSLGAITWTRGHSEKVAIVSDDRPGIGSENILKSDLVLPPSACTIATFHGRYVIRDSVSAWAAPKFRSP